MVEFKLVVHYESDFLKKSKELILFTNYNLDRLIKKHVNVSAALSYVIPDDVTNTLTKYVIHKDSIILYSIYDYFFYTFIMILMLNILCFYGITLI